MSIKLIILYQAAFIAALGFLCHTGCRVDSQDERGMSGFA